MQQEKWNEQIKNYIRDWYFISYDTVDNIWIGWSTNYQKLECSNIHQKVMIIKLGHNNKGEFVDLYANKKIVHLLFAVLQFKVQGRTVPGSLPKYTHQFTYGKEIFKNGCELSYQQETHGTLNHCLFTVFQSCLQCELFQTILGFILPRCHCT